jgi:hypothetical protein
MTKLAEYIKTKREDQSLLASDAVRMREEWLRQLDDLMADIDRWLAPAVAEGLKVTKATTQITERRLGTYTAPMRIIEFEDNRVTIQPIARILMGGHGRVDVKLQEPVATLIFWKPENRWLLVWERDWNKREPLTQEAFERLMEALL